MYKDNNIQEVDSQYWIRGKYSHIIIIFFLQNRRSMYTEQDRYTTDLFTPRPVQDDYKPVLVFSFPPKSDVLLLQLSETLLQIHILWY